MIDKNVQKFCCNYEAHIERTSRYYRRIAKPLWKISDYDNTSIANDHFINFTEVPMVNITLPEDRLSALVEHDQRISNFLESERQGPYVSKYQHLEAMIVEQEIECRLRHTNPALKKAWDNYQMLLMLAK